jgi:hypothetical protein
MPLTFFRCWHGRLSGLDFDKHPFDVPAGDFVHPLLAKKRLNMVHDPTAICSER